jgi:hypothetical protein
MRKSTPTINPLSPKGLAAMFHTDLRWSRRAHQNHKSNKSVSRRPLLLTRDNEQSSETSALADEHAVRACGLNSPRLFFHPFRGDVSYPIPAQQRRSSPMLRALPVNRR